MRIFPTGPRPLAQLAGILVTGLLFVSSLTQWQEPPRFDGASYALLARSLAAGHGYLQVEHPDQPPQTHYPPGYPIALALLGRLAGFSPATLHAFSAVCTLGALILSWCWFRRLVPPVSALLLGLALASNWLWTRDAAVIRSEPLFLLLSSIAVLLTDVQAQARRIVPALGLGLALGAATLTRHVGIMLVVACLTHLVLARRWRAAVVAGLTAALLLSPWLA